MNITSTLLYVVHYVIKNKLEFGGPSPFDDDGIDTDGPRLMLEYAKVQNGDYNITRNAHLLDDITPQIGYSLEGYSLEFIEDFEAAGVKNWMGNHSQGFALFVCDDQTLHRLKERLKPYIEV